MLLDNIDDLCGVSDEKDRTENGTLRDTGNDLHCPGISTVELDELSAAREVGLIHPLNECPVTP